MLRYLFDRLTLRDYDDALKVARIAVIKRFARGNVSFQNGYIMDDSALARIKRQGDLAIARLRKNRGADDAHAEHGGVQRASR